VRGGTLSFEEKTPHQYDKKQDTGRSAGNLKVLFAYYSLLIHILVVVFPFRAGWAIWNITLGLRKIARCKKWQNAQSSQRPFSTRLSSTDAPSYAQPSSTSSEAGDLESGYYADSEVEQYEVVYTILIPNYIEDIEVLRETLEVLACYPEARSQYDVSSPVLACVGVYSYCWIN
jgi:hypothetical protein